MSAKNGIYKTCTVCGKQYYVRNNRTETSKYCSKNCWINRRVLAICEYCNKPITSYFGKKYCSRECSHKAMVGDKATRWVDGKSLERDRARLGTQLKAWRKEVFMRDNYTCQECGVKGFIHAHHIKEWALYEDKRFDIDNGITLCVNCHSKIHGRRLG